MSGSLDSEATGGFELSVVSAGNSLGSLEDRYLILTAELSSLQLRNLSFSQGLALTAEGDLWKSKNEYHSYGEKGRRVTGTRLQTESHTSRLVPISATCHFYLLF